MSPIAALISTIRSTKHAKTRVGSVATKYVDPIRVEANQTYHNLGVRWYGEGVFARDAKLGREIKGTTLYRVRAGQFLYNRMFVTEGSFGLVTEAVAHGVVSGEFPAYDLDESRVDPAWFLLKFQTPEIVGAAAAQAMGGTKSRRRWKEEQFENFEIAIPPLELQREIVRVLQTFSRLNGALESERAGRQIQFEHYRQKLLSFGPDTARKRLGDIAEVRTGQAPPTDAIHEHGTYSFVNAGTGDSGRLDQFNTGGATVTIPSRGQGGVGISRYQNSPFWCGPLSYRVRPLNDDALLPKYLYHYLKSIQIELRSLQQTGGTPALNRKELITVEVPIPAVVTQAWIVDGLDNFEALVESESQGLPAEIALRRLQYAYYRDALLSGKGDAA